MKQFVSFITRISGFFTAHAWARVTFYGFVALALVLMFALMPQSEVAFVYNGF